MKTQLTFKQWCYESAQNLKVGRWTILSWYYAGKIHIHRTIKNKRVIFVDSPTLTTKPV